jgi:hypothetical protein
MTEVDVLYFAAALKALHIAPAFLIEIVKLEQLYT